MKVIYTILFLLLPVSAFATDNDSVPKKQGLFCTLYEFVKDFTHVDSAYIEPQKYNFTVMLQNTNNFEAYWLSSKSGQKISFAPKPSIKMGPYVGWRWVFLGYTIDFSHLNEGSKKQDLTLSLYSNQVGVDIFYRQTGNDYKIRYMDLGPNVNTKPLENASFGGLQSSIKGFNLYYIFNHHKFSYPAAYSQSTRQKRSAGSFLAGIGYTRHSLQVDWSKLDDLVKEKLGSDIAETQLDSSLQFGRIHYSDSSVSGGYAYNWVFAHNWLIDLSLSMALAYKRTTGDMDHRLFSLRDFTLKNFNLDGVGRFGIVWNNSRWYAGANAIFHSYNYRKSQFSTNTYFGSVNIYVGFNFGRQ
ncbi:MAG: DUF4421 domain-containing protein [Prevotella sp.]|nr:DUF4421 domain-containing protein [Prevotella sp.]MCI1281647.1 DUF4421 domain-containing protein [Prevotella sp.]